MIDKNLGPATMERDKYIKEVLRQCLLDDKIYQQPNENQARKILTELQ